MKIRQCFLSNESGFTLLELILSTLIFSIVMMTIGAGMFAIQQTWSKVSKKALLLDYFMNIDKVFDSSVRNAVPFTWLDSTLNERIVFAGYRDSVLLPYRHRIIDINDGGIRFIRLYLKGGKLMADYRNIPMLPWVNISDIPNVNTEMLAENINSISFLYADRGINNSIIWVDQWDTSKNQNLPLAIQLTVYWKDGTMKKWLRRTAGSGKFESYGKWVNKNENQFF